MHKLCIEFCALCILSEHQISDRVFTLLIVIHRFSNSKQKLSLNIPSLLLFSALSDVTHR